ncbi:hypothetical protein [Herbaspirillum rubrisubalbicans]|uniref:Uncharacterized protein n=1 Tax=Herbaspirillum rubrisubalbicans TaxID=80842 RepID=A0AAD0U8H4_9BURK|nr:hypothetical protein [Herbaspirillum rubrisubalbicans]AYR24236.1 hypothetical protein RC54_10530 [Herbaspirillum rubrisubalbicans]
MSYPVIKKIQKQTFTTLVRNVKLNVWTDGQSCSAYLFFQRGDQTPTPLAYAISHTSDRCHLRKAQDQWSLWIGSAAFEINEKDYQTIADLLGCAVVQEVAA